MPGHDQPGHDDAVGSRVKLRPAARPDALPSSFAQERVWSMTYWTSCPGADGMNLVALEGPLVNPRDGVLVLSTAARPPGSPAR